MWWIAAVSGAVAASASPLGAPAAAPAHVVVSQARVVVRIVNAATVDLGHSATDRYALEVPATDTRFRDADGSYRPARIVEFP